MSAATRATTAKQRANIAAGFIRRGKTDSRAFDDCFEMGDADEVVTCLLKKAHTDPRIAEFGRRCGWDNLEGFPDRQNVATNVSSSITSNAE